MTKISHELVKDLEISNWFLPREEIVNQFIRKFTPIAKMYSKMLCNKGYLVLLDRIPWLIATYGYYLSLCEERIFPNMSTYRYLSISSLDEDEKMPFVVAQKNGDPESRFIIKKEFKTMLDIQEKVR